MANTGRGGAPIQVYLGTVKCEFRVVHFLTCHEVVFLSSLQPFKTVKTILSSQAAQNSQWAGLLVAGFLSTPDLVGEE